jgi:hypothetical protein
MRAVAIWCAIGFSVLALKAHLDLTGQKYADVAVASAGTTYFIPRPWVRSEGWRADLMRLAGCWDAREPGLVGAAAAIACEKSRRLNLVVPTADLGGDVAAALRAERFAAVFWSQYEPPADQLEEFEAAWRGEGDWRGRQATWRDDWGLWRVETGPSPWVYLMADAPKSSDGGDLRRSYAGRCYRPERASDAGMSCSFVLRDAAAALEFALTSDEMMCFVALLQALTSILNGWLNPFNVC